ncbi:MAG: hypothetical protein K0B11_07595 [Mariniphaga sp.]|nr:hypothetical protein [Mariniphaga sp.]
MENRKHIAMRIRPDVNFYGKQVAKFRNRAFSNLVEFLLLQEIEKAKAEGFEFENYVPEGGEIGGNPGEKDNALNDVFKQFAVD